MNSIPIGGPAVEPISLEEMKAYLRIDPDDEGQDALITGLVKAARLMVEAASRRILIEQRWRVMLDRWPKERRVVMPLSPVIGLESIKVVDASGEATEVAPEAIGTDLVSDPPVITVSNAPDPGKPRNGIVIEALAGYGSTPDAVPAPLRLAIKVLVARWFENRGDVAGEQTLPPEAAVFLRPFQRARL